MVVGFNGYKVVKCSVRSFSPDVSVYLLLFLLLSTNRPHFFGDVRQMQMQKRKKSGRKGAACQQQEQPHVR